MKTEPRNMIDFLNEDNKSFIIPVYQRNYDWIAEAQCQTLWEDLEHLIEHKNKPHFFGTIVSVMDNKGTSQDVLIIDGQQRVVTVSLLLLAMVYSAKLFNSVSSEVPYVIPDEKDVLSLCITANRLKLKLLNGDMQAYENVYKSATNCESLPNKVETKIEKNYKFFCEKITPANINAIFNALKQLMVVDIVLTDEDDNPQQVFESLNSKGLSLDEADKIRNFMLMEFPYGEQQELCHQYWETMEKNVENPTLYIWYFLDYKIQKKTDIGNLYKDFKQYKDDNQNAKNILKELYELSKIYNLLIKSTHANPEINHKLITLKEIDCLWFVIPMFLDLFARNAAGQVSDQDVLQIMDIVEAYHIRRTVCRYNRSGVFSFFLMNDRLRDLLDTDTTYVEAFKQIVKNAPMTLRFPNDQEVATFLQGDIGTAAGKKICKSVLLKLEKSFGDQSLQQKSVKLEHIMPRNLSQEWIQELGSTGSDPNLIHAQYFDTLGNLTLINKGTVMGNRPFSVKKTMQNGFDTSTLALNSYLKNATVWTEKELKERNEILAERFLTIYPMF